MTTKTDEKERAAFEESMSCQGEWPQAIERAPDGGYKLAQTAAAWEVWQSAWDAALQSQDREDGERLDWLLRHLPGDAIRYCVGVIADTADIDELRAAIDHARRVEGDGD